MFRDLQDNEEEFNIFVEKQLEDDRKVKDYFEKCSHIDFTRSLINLGVLLDVSTTYLEFIMPQLHDIISNNPEKSYSRKIKKLVKDTNERINIEFDFDKETNIIKECIYYNNEFYILFDKSGFLKEIDLKKLEIM